MGVLAQPAWLWRYTRCLFSALARRDEHDQYVLVVDPETAKAPDLPTRFEKVI